MRLDRLLSGQRPESVRRDGCGLDDKLIDYPPSLLKRAGAGLRPHLLVIGAPRLPMISEDC